ncbi:cadherin-like domain-containing protein [Aliikangiella maris]|uniref:Cadherin-like domain-containing protein n=2 Tax=Aliikangiella maris TaxID=3162458 RepID=A0ABV2BQ04_9GAMM
MKLIKCSINSGIAVLSLVFLLACGSGGSNPAPSGNETPTAVNDSANVAFQGSVTIDVIANDSDADGDSLSIASITQPSVGTATIENGQIVYQAVDVAGKVTFTYQVSDGTATSESATVTVTVANNQLPVAQNDSATMNLNESLLIDVLANDNDSEMHDLTIQIEPSSIEALQGVATIEVVEGKVLFEPLQSGELTFEYRLFDGYDVGEKAHVTVNVSAIDLVLKGRLNPLVGQISVYADNVDSEKTVTSDGVTDAQGYYSLNVTIDNLQSFVSLRAAKAGERLYYLSHVGSAKKLLALKDNDNQISVADYPLLELSAISTATTALMNLNKQPTDSMTDTLMESLRESVDGKLMMFLASMIQQYIDGNVGLPEGINTLPSLLHNASKIEAFSFSQSDTEHEPTINLLLEWLAVDREYAWSNGRQHLYAKNDIYADGNISPIVYEKNANGTLRLTTELSVLSAQLNYHRTIEVDHLLNWELSENNHLRISTSAQSDILLPENLEYVAACDGYYNTYLTLTHIEIIPVYTGESIVQFIVKYSGDNTAGESFEMPCMGLDDYEWSQAQLVTLPKENFSIDEIIQNGRVALRIGKVNSSDGYSMSASIVGLNTDGTSYIEYNQYSGQWNQKDSGELVLTTDNSTQVEYFPIGKDRSAVRFSALETDNEGNRRLFAGLMMNVDKQLSLGSIEGRYEVLGNRDYQQGSAYSFQNNGLGQQETQYPGSEWQRIPLLGADLSYFKWQPDSSGLGLTAEYLASSVAENTYENRAKTGCLPDDLECSVWRQRSFRIVAVEGEVVYALMNGKQNFSLFGVTGTDMYWGYLGMFKKTDFVLPELTYD